MVDLDEVLVVVCFLSCFLTLINLSSIGWVKNILISQSGLMDKKFGHLWKGFWESDGNEILWTCMMWVGDAL